MSIKSIVFTIPLIVISSQSFAGSKLDAAIGGGIGGATGAAIGYELGGKEGAILGGAVGGATGAAITTDGSKNESNYRKQPVSNTNQGSFCPPGQHKKGRC